MIQFHDGRHQDLIGYTGGRAWNDSELLNRPVGKMAIWNTGEAVIRGLLNASNLQLEGLAISALAVHGTEVLWVIKGFHQTANPANALMQECHLTIGFRGALYHVACWFTGGQALPTVSRITAGAKHQVDLDGYKTVGRKGRGR